MSKHTPGPWTYERNLEGEAAENLEIIGPNDVSVVRGCGCCGSPYMDNAHDAPLIAAAPDLLEALEEAMLLHNELAPHMGSMSTDTVDYINGIVSQMQAVIAKAKGAA